MKRFFFLLLFLAQPLHAASEDSFRWKVSFLPAIRNGYVFPGSNSEKVSNQSLLAGKNFPGSGRAKGLRAWGAEGDVVYALAAWGGPFATLRAVPFSLRLPNGPEQNGIDWFASLGYEISSKIGDSYLGHFRLGVRTRRWEIEHGPFPDSGQAGLAISGELEGESWFALVETGLAAFNFGNGSALGLQRDASTLRVQAGAKIPTAAFLFRPSLEFFHTHRNFYATTLVAGDSSLFVDEVSLALVLAAEW